MKKTWFLILLTVSCASLYAQEDVVVMRVNGQPVTRSEFEYFYNKNNSESVIDKKSVEEYAQLYADYKLKVLAAKDAHLDTLSSFQKEFRSYRDQQIRPLLIPAGAVDSRCRSYYDRILESLQGKELLQTAHIFMRLPQNASQQEQDELKVRMDSVYAVLQTGADFAELAKQLSQDTQTAARGGVLPWIGPNQTLKEFEDVAYSLEVGQYSQPFLSPVGYHIVKLMAKKPLESYEELKPNIKRYLESQGLENQLSSSVLDSLVQESGSQKTVEQILDEQTERLCAQDLNLKYLVQEYYEGLLLFEECSREVWEPAKADTAGIQKYFKSNKKKYSWSEPHYRGMVYYCQNEKDVKAVKKALKKVDINKWTTTIRDAFNKDSVTVRMERRMFVKGENGYVDRLVFKDKNAEVKEMKNYPYVAVVGKVLKKGPSEWTDVSNQVVSDYQRSREEAFVQELRKRYTVEIDAEALKTVNKQ